MRFSFMALRKVWLSISLALIALSFLALGVFGLEYGVDFTGGTLLEVEIAGMTSTDDVSSALLAEGYDVSVQQGEGSRVFVRSGVLSEEQHQHILEIIRGKFPEAQEQQYTFVGPSVGERVRSTAIIALIILLVCIALYVAWAFRKVSEPVASWKFGVITLISALHDVILPLGVFAVLGRVWGYQVDTAFVAAILTILGYSINDTIVVFDRIRERLGRARSGESFIAQVDESVKETLGRSLNTTLTTLLPLIAIFTVGGDSTRPFALALIVGIVSGAYSSIFLASPLLILSEEWGKKRG